MKKSTIEVSRHLKRITAIIDDEIERVAGERVAFALVVYTEERTSYISSAARDESMRAMEELIAKWKQGMPDIPAHEVM